VIFFRRREQAALEGGGEELSRIGRPHLFHHHTAMCLDGLDADLQRLGDLFGL